MKAQGKQRGKAAWGVRPVHIDYDLDPVAHRYRDVLVADDAGVLGRPLIIRRRLVAGRKNCFGSAGVVVFHCELGLQGTITTLVKPPSRNCEPSSARFTSASGTRTCSNTQRSSVPARAP